jgi:hypothetical protein
MGAEEEENMPSKILSGMSLEKPSGARTPRRVKSRMVMEVVMHTPRRGAPQIKDDTAGSKSTHVNGELALRNSIGSH